MKIFLFIILLLIILYIYFFKKQNRLPYEVVVAKYDEDISWTKKFKHVRVYDKFENKDLPNIGRESHTYLTYIIENYYNLPDVIFFTQGNMSDHYNENTDFLNIKDFSKNLSIEISDRYFLSPDTRIFSKDHLYSYRNMVPYPMDELGFRKWFNKYVDKDYDINSHIYLWWSAIFSIKKEYILSRSKEYYQTLLDYIPKTNNPEVGHYFERSWFYIFNCHK